MASVKLMEVDGVAVEREETPSSPEELSDAMKRACDAGLSMIPVGGATQLELGNPPRSARLALRTTGLCGIVEYEPDNMTVSVRAGTPLAELQAVLAAGNQLLPIDPPHPARATAGGIVAANASGPLRFRYGTIRDMLIGVKICHADGTQTKAGGKLVKNVTGYDMCKLYTGALGTLGVLTELTFKVQPRSESLATVVLNYSDSARALEATQLFLRSGLLPDAIEAYNASACSRLPLVDPRAPWLLFLRFGEVDAAVRWQVARTEELAPSTGATATSVLGPPETESFWAAAASARAAPWQGGDELRVKCSVLYRSVPGTVAAIEEAGRRLEAETAIFCHAGNYVIYGRYRWPASGRRGQAELREALSELRRHVAASGGHAVVEKARPDVKNGWDAWGYDAPALEVMRRIKNEFDPKGLLNPGRFVGGI